MRTYVGVERNTAGDFHPKRACHRHELQESGDQQGWSFVAGLCLPKGVQVLDLQQHALDCNVHIQQLACGPQDYVLHDINHSILVGVLFSLVREITTVVGTLVPSS